MIFRIVLLVCISILGACELSDKGRNPSSIEFDVSGVAAIGLIHSGEVTAYQFGDDLKGSAIGSGYVDSEGRFSLVASVEMGAEDKHIIVCVNSGSYTDEVTGQLEYIEQDICATHYPGSYDVVISAFSDFSLAYASYKIQNDNNDPISAISSANNSVSTLFGFLHAITLPESLTLPSSHPDRFDDPLKMGLMSAALSQLVVTHTHNVEGQVPLSVVEFYKLVSEDIEYDGLMNGISQAGQLWLGNTAVNREMYSTGVGNAALDFINSEANVAQPTYFYMYLELTRFVSSTGSLYPPLLDGEALPTLD
jgi:hypothetical protein